MTANTDPTGGRTGKRPGVYFPWIIALLALLLLMIANSYNYTFGVFFKPIADGFGWGRAEMSAAFAIRSLLCAVFVVPMGFWADRYGPRRVLLPCFILLGASMMAVATVTELWQLYLIQGAGIGIGMSGPFVCIMSTVAKWHDAKRGLALGIASAGAGLSSVFFPPLAAQLIQARDWQFAIFVLGAMILAIGVPGSVFMKDPSILAKRPAVSGVSMSRGPLDAWALLLRFLKNPTFLSLFIMFVLMSAAGNMLISHLVNYATDTGVTALVAAAMVSAMGVAGTIGRLAVGAVSDRIGTRRDTALCCILLGVSFLLLITRMPVFIWTSAVIFGVGWGGTIPLIPALMGERVAREQLSTATGVGTMGIFIGAALGPWLGGLIFDASGSYLWALLLAAAASSAALIIILRMPSAKWDA